MIPDDIVERVRESADIVQIIGEYVPLKRSGADYRGPCPFHQGTHRNFSVSSRRNMYYCFVCHEGGDVFTFLQKRLGVDWPSAVRMVASRSGIEIPEDSARHDAKDPREPVWELNATAAEYFSDMLWGDAQGADARAYLQGRGIEVETARRFGLGYAPREIGLLRSHMETLGFDEQRLLAAGLLVQREESSLPRPRFLGRLIFPIHDVSGHCVGFGGRLIGPGEPKYLNSADSEVFSKGKILYGLHWAKSSIRKEDRALLVEGYFDVVRLVSKGLEHVVAPLGTALTREQSALLSRYTKNALLLYDSDRAGLKATFRAGDMLLAHGMSVQVVTLPKGEDPDTFVSRHGREALDEKIAQATDVFERKIQLLERSGWFGDLTHRRRALDRLLPTIRAAADPLTRDLYVSRASEASGVRPEIFLREVQALHDPGMAPTSDARGEHRATAASSPRADARSGRRRRIPAEAAERKILAAVLQLPGKLEWLAERLGQDDFWVPEHKVLFEAFMRSTPEIELSVLERELPPEAVALLQSLIEEGTSIVDVPTTMEDSLRRIESRKLERRLFEINRQMPLASGEEQNVLMREQLQLASRSRELSAHKWRFTNSNSKKRG